ncbi:type VI secretion system contractile sheath large subunit [Simiduia sp. 21SJ11W-1]|uniref:type VI secretion system contractile sheath domain-containing protein n=1 Tax=Simiduia sp. 21SJ11W-1 TaxID=2909669 RepID=UPI0020A042AA|nr:type VI secretion system contractile sheath large subunit [Simiduia sp. 21SJ11W-1]UTA48422.1 type VI secretion system contractile sheath large subunit [Simiduia sp. 21SJ11W-1]
MARVTMSTGGLVFGNGADFEDERERAPSSDSGQPLHMILMGDYSGRGSRGVLDLSSLGERPLREVNRDNLDEVFSALKVQLALPGCATPLGFELPDDLHPDTLYTRMPLFARLRELKAQLANPLQFEQAAAEIARMQSATDASDTAAVAIPADLFERKSGRLPEGEQDVSALIAQIVAPFVEPKADPRQSELMNTLDLAASDALRGLLHTGFFQRLEANWRSLELLVRRLETGRNLKLFLLDVSEAEVRADFAASNDITQSALYQRLVTSFQVPGATPYSVLVSDITLTDNPADVRVAAGLSALAVYGDAIALVSGHERIAGCASLAATPDVEDWAHPVDEEFAKLWAVLRNEPQSDSLLVAAPRFLVRLPYGERTSPIESFDFDELGPGDNHRHYLWGAGAVLAALLIGQSFNRNFWDFSTGLVTRVPDLALHVYRDALGDTQITPAAEIYMTDATASALRQAGLCPLRSVKGEAAVLMPSFASLSAAGHPVLAVISA